MKTSYFQASPILLVLISLLLACPGAFADDPNVWGRWGAGGDVAAVVDVGGSLEIGEVSDPSLFNPGLNNLGLPGPDGLVPAPANPGDWVMYGAMFLNIFEFGEEGPLDGEQFLFRPDILVAVTEGTLLLRPPDTEGAVGQLGFNINRFIDVGLFSGDGGGEVLFPVAVLAGGPGVEPVNFPDAPEFVPFSGEGDAVANVPGFVEGFGFIQGSHVGEGFGGIPFLLDEEPGSVPGAEIDFLAEGFFAFFLEIQEGEGGFIGEIGGDGLFFAGQPTADISGLQAGNVIAQYAGFSGLGFDVSVTMNFAPATFTAGFSESEAISGIGSFGVAGTINGSSFTSNTFVPGEGGDFVEVTGATVDGTLFGPNAEALGGLVTFDATDGESTFSGADVFAASQEGTPLPGIVGEFLPIIGPN